MLFNDPVFLFIFLPAVVVAAAVARRLGGARAVLGLLVAASAVFYAWWNPVYLPLLAALTVFNYALARWMTADRLRGRLTRIGYLLTFGIAVDLLVLGYFKYADFFIGTTNAVLDTRIPLQGIVLPLGISFFMFQKIAYLVDASRGEVSEHDFLEYCFFVAFFPQLIAGPIVHHHEIFAQTRAPQAFAIRPSNFMVGLTIFIIGLFKKVVLADHLAPYATGVFNDATAGASLGFFQAWQGAVAYTFQLYFDFSGYSDMAIGAARLFGIRLPLNFESPYQATSIIDFWQRWHMTLSRFLRDYVYFSLGGNRHGRLRRYINLLLTMTIGGLWHGAAWTFVLWGFMHGVYLVANHAWRALWVPIDAWWSRSVARLVTLLAFVVSLVLFRAPTLDAALTMYRGMIDLPKDIAGPLGPFLAGLGVHFDGPPVEPEDLQALLWGVLWVAVLWFVPNTQQLMARFRPAFNYTLANWRRMPPILWRLRPIRSLLLWRPDAFSAALVGILAALACLSLQHVSEFLYFEF